MRVYYFYFLLFLFSLATVFSPSYADDLSFDKKYLSILGFELERSHLLSIRKKLGEAPIHQSGAGANITSSICYFDETNKATIFFESNPMGGKNMRLMNFTVLAGNPQHNTCGKLQLAEISLHVGELVLGRDINKVTKSLPQPVEYIKGYGYLHKHFSRIPFSEADIQRLNISDLRTAFWSVSIYIEIFEHQNRVTGFKVTKLTSW